MAGVSAKSIKNRIRSMESTRQITRAMELVAASKLRKAQNQAITTRPYYTCLYETINNIASSAGEITSDYMSADRPGKVAYILIAGDRGLSGGYNNNVFKLLPDKPEAVFPIGKKAVEYCVSRSINTISEAYISAEKTDSEDCMQIARTLCQGFLSGKYSRICVLFTNFVSVLTQTPASLQLLPLEGVSGKPAQSEMLYEPDAETVLSAVIPEYIGGVIYGALCESRASEQAARRSAMDSATQNADTMIEDLSLQLNRARQAAITREITEIVAGV
ncbi:MAG: ATP synthase F1 subunit gamma [Ruminococcaceae bacterium]|nr:ATP synthase F1 subunit gamma [Oscillospiraceae bacterium]